MIAVIGTTEVMVDIRMGAPERHDEQEGYGMQSNADMGDFPSREELEEEIFKEGRDKMTFRSSGCGFNIAGYLADEGFETAFISAVGSDIAGIGAIEELKARGVDISGVARFEGTTPVKVTFFNILGDEEMEKKNNILMDMITPGYIEKCEDILKNADAVVVDGNIPEETIKYICDKYGDDPEVKLFFDPAGKPGAVRGSEYLGAFSGIMPGRVEAETLTGKTILSEDQLMAAGSFFADKGVGKTVITMKGGGLYYKEVMNEGILRPEKIISFASTAGAGDVASAAVIAETMRGGDIEAAGKHAMDRAADFLKDIEDKNIL